MNKSIKDFIDEQIDGEPLTTDTIAWAIKKYIYMNYIPSKQDKLDLYESLLHTIAEDVNNGSQHIKKLITNIRNWSYARTAPNMETDLADQTALENETFYNLTKL